MRGLGLFPGVSHVGLVTRAAHRRKLRPKLRPALSANGFAKSGRRVGHGGIPNLWSGKVAQTHSGFNRFEEAQQC